MARFVVLTEHCTLGEVDAVVDLDSSPAVDALVAAGHLKPATKRTAKKAAKKTTKK